MRKFGCVGELFSSLEKFLWENENLTNTFKLTHKNEQNTNETLNLKCGRVSYPTCIIFINFLSIPLIIIGAVKIAQFPKSSPRAFRSVADETLALSKHELADHFNFTANNFVANFQAVSNS